MAMPFAVYFAGIGTVVAALGVGFGGALFLTSTTAVKEGPSFATKVERSRLEEPKPDIQKQERAAPAVEPASTTGSAPAAATGTQTEWVLVPPTVPPQTLSAPVVPLTAPLAAPAAEAPASAPAVAVQRPATAAPPALPATKDIAVDEKKRKAAEQNDKKAISAKERLAEEQDVVAESTPAPERPAESPGMKTIGAVSGNSH